MAAPGGHPIFCGHTLPLFKGIDACIVCITVCKSCSLAVCSEGRYPYRHLPAHACTASCWIHAVRLSYVMGPKSTCMESFPVSSARINALMPLLLEQLSAKDAPVLEDGLQVTMPSYTPLDAFMYRLRLPIAIHPFACVYIPASGGTLHDYPEPAP